MVAIEDSVTPFGEISVTDMGKVLRVNIRELTLSAGETLFTKLEKVSGTKALELLISEIELFSIGVKKTDNNEEEDPAAGFV